MKYKHVLASVSAGALVGCSSLSTSMAPADPGALADARGQGVPARQASPSRQSSGPVTDLDALYQQGRAAQESGDPALAQSRYSRVLALAPNHTQALNALGVLRARGGQLTQALTLFERALAVAPQSVTLRNNRGYALLLAGRLDEAQAELKTARALAPDNAQTRANLAQLEQTRLSAASAGAAQPQPAVQLVAVAPHVYELRDTAAAGPLPGVRLEVSNGVGIRHLARRTAQGLAAWGLVTARLSNQPGYRQARTEIQYSTGHQGAAQALAERLPLTPAVSAARLAPKVQLRLILGHDQAGRAIAEWIESASRTVAAQETASGWLPG